MTTALKRNRNTEHRRPLAAAVLALAALAWVGLAWPDLLAHHGGAATPDPMAHMGHLPVGPAVGPVLLAWVVMVVAMMLPPALPLLTTVAGLAVGRGCPMLLAALAGATFVAVWTVAGAALLGLDTALRQVLVLAADPGTAAAVVLVAAGLYQLSPLAQRCLTACRSPRSTALRYWTGRRPAWAETVGLSASYGLTCVGCCWALMVISLTVAVAALPVMVVLAVVMAAQRLLPHGRRLVRPTGFLVLALGIAALAGFLPAGVLVA
ncbi:DUF2182 domain-containing protein [Actinomycetospora soli]|uniref:DUF2182 domain-containing protein n=1 Tax=Actinomycetospora soli TaxID=2893887 RepID=UPI001E425C99|nr:DUF2182 domain-containing protein [Actinomycetospora soli]MCD2187009.1 DUF2182 domain-containing protein [Actinomycetospora soli]